MKTMKSQPKVLKSTHELAKIILSMPGYFSLEQVYREAMRGLAQKNGISSSVLKVLESQYNITEDSNKGNTNQVQRLQKSDKVGQGD